MTANINSVLGLGLVAVNNAQNQTIVNISLQGITLGCTAIYCDQYFQVGTTTTVVPLPAASIYIAYARNLGSNLISGSYTMGGNVGTFYLGPVTNGFGGVWMIFETVETTPAITAISLQATSAITPVEIYVGY